MIQERADSLVTLIEHQGELRNQLHLLDGFRSQSDAVKIVARRVEELLTVWRLFGHRGIRGASVPPNALTLQNNLEELRASFSADPTYILGPNRLAAVKNAVPAFAVSFEQELLSAWGNYGISRRPPVNQEVLSVLASVAALRRQVDRVTVGFRDLDERLTRLPVTEVEIDQFDRKAAEVTAAWNELDSDHLSPDVLLFLKEAGSLRGADLDRVTEQVLQWLQQHNLTGAFRIRQNTT